MRLRKTVLMFLLLAIATVSAHDLLITKPLCQKNVVLSANSGACDGDNYCAAHAVMHQSILHEATDFSLPRVNATYEAFPYRHPISHPNDYHQLQPPRFA